MLVALAVVAGGIWYLTTLGNEPEPGTIAYIAWNRAFGDADTGQDVCGATIKRNKYADFEDDQGWDVDHIFPRAFGGGNEATNLRPLQWVNNRTKDNALDPDWTCARGDREGLPPF